MRLCQRFLISLKPGVAEKNHHANIGYKLKWIKDVYQLHEPYKYKILLDGYTCICYVSKCNHFQEYNTCS